MSNDLFESTAIASNNNLTKFLINNHLVGDWDCYVFL